MPTYMTPGIYVEEIPGGARPIQAVGTSTAGFVGVAPDPTAHLNEIVAINNWSQFLREFVPENGTSTPLSHGVFGFFLNGGTRCYVVNTGLNKPITGTGRNRQGIDLFEEVDEIAIVAAPGFTDPASYEALLAHCEKLKDRVAILEAPGKVTNIDLLTKVATAPTPDSGGSSGGGGAPASQGLKPRQSDNGFGAFYFPNIIVRDPLSNDLVEAPVSGHIAGIWARSDATRGVHKAPANEPVRGALNLTYRLTSEEQGELNQNGVNCLRLFAREGIRVWGARTLAAGASEWRYLNVRRLFNMIEESIAVSTRWIVFEPNDRTLWKSIRRDVSAFLTRIWRDGGLMGTTPEEAFFVLCDEETNPPEVIDAGQVVTLIGIAPVKPAEFIIFRITQTSSGAEIEAQGGTNG
ncbi:MAG: phage tail sheath family protein [Chloroflexi bacterium]|mgnify:FL=1|nr:phage tail sheath family protein [Chloroflexota bacterium]OJV92836.1 MAG: phage tail protein [Chloroflexi bacterium 54-19]